MERLKELRNQLRSIPTRFDKEIWKLFTGYSDETIDTHLKSSKNFFDERKAVVEKIASKQKG